LGFHDMSLMYMDGKNTLTMVTSEPMGQMEVVFTLLSSTVHRAIVWQ